MAAKDKDKVVIQPEDNGEKIHNISVENIIAKYEITMKGWEHTKGQLLGGHKSIVDSILHDVGCRDSENRVSGNGEKNIQKPDIVKGNVEGVIEETVYREDYSDIDFLGFEEDFDDDVVRDASEMEMQQVVVLTEDDDASDDVTYVPQTSSSNTEEVSLFDDLEVVEMDVEDDTNIDEDGMGNESYDEDNLGSEGNDGPMEEQTALQRAEGEASRPSLAVGMTYEDKKVMKRAIDNYSITRGVNLRIVRSDRTTFRVVCEDECPFTLYASTYGLVAGWQVKSLLDEHMCPRVYENPRALATWLAEHFKDKVQETPQMRTKDMKKEIQRDLKVNVSIYKCKRAKKKIMEEMEGSFKEEFGKLEAYCNELRRSNPGSDVSVEVSTEELQHGRRIFKRMYLCFNASKVGWKEGCRPLIGVDGTFLKGKSRGILLTAVGIDGNESLYPLAFGLVDRENSVNWSWFLQWIQTSLGLGNGDTVTLMSDMQKGLANAIAEVLPEAEHRFCARHIYANWSKKWRGNELKKKFFTCAWSTFVQDFKDNLQSLGSIKKEAAEDALTYNVKSWVRAYFTPRCKSWVVDNNMTESYNAWIDEYRFLPVIKMFEGIRLKMMAKWAESDRNVCGWNNDFSPKCIDLFESNRFLAANCGVFFNGDKGYEVVEGLDRHLVDLRRGMCTCKAWDLTSIPCQHAICAMYHAKIDPKSRISQYYHKETYLTAYRTKLKKFWDSENVLPMQPPPVTKLPGRPQKKRIRTDESDRRRKTSASRHHYSGTPVEKLSKRGKTQKCTFCNKTGHNRATCKVAPQQKGSKGMRYTSVQVTAETQPSQQFEASFSQSLQQPLTLTQHTPQNSQPTPSNSQPSKSSYKKATRSTSYKPRAASGFGIRFDEVTGRSVYNPGLSSEVVIEADTGHDLLHYNTEIQTKFPIPNKRALRLSRVCNSSEPRGSRIMQFEPATTSSPPSNLPYVPPGLQWRGQACLTTRQLLAQTQREIKKKERQGKDA